MLLDLIRDKTFDKTFDADKMMNCWCALAEPQPQPRWPIVVGVPKIDLPITAAFYAYMFGVYDDPVGGNRLWMANLLWGGKRRPGVHVHTGDTVIVFLNWNPS